MALILIVILQLILSVNMSSAFPYKRFPQELLPQGIARVESESDRDPITEIEGRNVGVVKGIKHQNKFEVVNKHDKLTDQATGNVTGVRFNVETLPRPLREHRNLRTVNRNKTIEGYQNLSAQFYRMKDIRIEAASQHSNDLVHVGGNGFLFATVSSFAYHLPLVLTPDHIWMLISYAFAKHVDQNAEELRSSFVKHEGKKRLLVQTGENFSMSQYDNPDSGASAEEWESIIFPEFSRQIKEHTGDKTHSTITTDFSTTTKGSRAATEITLMAAMKNYFSYGVKTLCGIPEVTLMGTEEDWKNLRERAEALGHLMKPEFANRWMPFLLPVLDEFVESYKGNVNHTFWQTMVKLRGTSGSGAHDFISGWMQIFFPILASGRMNVHLRSWQNMYFAGPDPDDFPDILSTAPVDWNYFGEVFDLSFHAGVMGCSQDPTSGALMPVISWFVSHTPEQHPRARLVKIKNELEGLLLGHKEEAKAEILDKTQPWYQRVLVLEGEKAELESILSLEGMHPEDLQDAYEDDDDYYLPPEDNEL